MKRTRSLLSIALPAALATALVLTGCASGSPDDSKTTSGADCAAPGTASDSVKLEGKLGKELKLTSKTPITVKSLERTVAITGDGEAVKEGASATVEMSVFNGKTGEAVAPAAPATLVNKTESLAPWAAKAVTCSAIGDRVVVVTTASDVLGAGGGATYKLDDADALVIVFDFMKLATTRAEGKAVDAPAGFPEVKLAADGAPTITIPKGEKAPTKLKTATIIEGSGAKVAATDTVRLQYTGAVWSNGKVFDSSSQTGQPISLAANQFVPGFTEAIVGQKVGSQIIAIIPAHQGYGKNTAKQLSSVNATKDDVMVFVIDILEATPAG